MANSIDAAHKEREFRAVHSDPELVMLPLQMYAGGA
jgi:hypothetical protein